MQTHDRRAGSELDKQHVQLLQALQNVNKPMIERSRVARPVAGDTVYENGFYYKHKKLGTNQIARMLHSEHMRSEESLIEEREVLNATLNKLMKANPLFDEEQAILLALQNVKRQKSRKSTATANDKPQQSEEQAILHALTDVKQFVSDTSARRGCPVVDKESDEFEKAFYQRHKERGVGYNTIAPLLQAEQIEWRKQQRCSVKSERQRLEENLAKLSAQNVRAKANRRKLQGVVALGSTVLALAAASRRKARTSRGAPALTKRKVGF
jgi:hypothetical protein